MDIKPRPNHRLYIQILRRMTPEQRLLQAFEMSDFTRSLFLEGLRQRFPQLSEDELRNLYLQRLEKCHNRNY
ncbi:MAG: hypothetical protein Q7T82_04710 [Armatimonadota bacterium]|nr:hypothetical protein [Armatimonadota bacterium]